MLWAVPKVLSALLNASLSYAFLEVINTASFQLFFWILAPCRTLPPYS